jgi:glycogen synthase
MRVLMLGWEFPPYISGGLGTACFGLTKALDSLGVEICFVLPRPVPIDGTDHVRFRSPDISLTDPAADEAAPPEPTETDQAVQAFRNVELRRVDAGLEAYAQPTDADIADAIQQLHQADALPTDNSQAVPADEAKTIYSGDLMEQIRRYEKLVVSLAHDEPFDVIHAHDWMTYPAGLAVAALTGKPLVAHVHSTEFDRAGEHPNEDICAIEQMGMQRADRVICVSHLTATICHRRYEVPEGKTVVVYNAVELPADADSALEMAPIAHDEKIVLFLGRITMQKGPEYFLQAAKKVIEKEPNVRFVIAGSGDLIRQCISTVADLQLGRHVTFTGFLRGDDVQRVFRMADLYVMPSVSEPFGIAPLEALSNNVPVLISKQSGVSEILSHVLKVDFWDTAEMADKILAVLRHPPLQRTLRESGQIEVRKLSWRDSAEKLKAVYTDLVGHLPDTI